MEVRVAAADIEGTHALAGLLAQECATRGCVLLYGELGAGKTEFARGFIRELLGRDEEIVSPTFTLAQQYRAQDGTPIWHFDLYRLKGPQEIQEIGLEEALESGISLIEWPQLAEGWLPREALGVYMEAGDAPGRRRISLRAEDPLWEPRLARVEKRFYSLKP